MEEGDHRFDRVTMTGRLCYIFMCIERYLLSMYPDRDWTVVARNMWKWAEEFWCDGWDYLCCVTPDEILKYKDFEAVQEEPVMEAYVSLEDYEQLIALYRGITDGRKGDELTRVLNLPIELCNWCDGRDYSDKIGESETLDSIDEIEQILKAHQIALPDASLVSAFQIREDVRFRDHRIDRWGMCVKSDHLSIILNKPGKRDAASRQ